MNLRDPEPLLTVVLLFLAIGRESAALVLDPSLRCREAAGKDARVDRTHLQPLQDHSRLAARGESSCTFA